MKRTLQKLKLSTCLFALLFGFNTISNAQTITTDLSTGTSTSNYIPIYGYYGYSYSQQIYLASDFNPALAGQPSNITKIRFYNVSGSVTNSNNWTLYMGQTALTDFATTTSWVPAANMQSVYTGTLVTPAPNSWIEITLSTPFAWDGISNIVVGIDENTSGYSSITWGSYATGANRSILYYNDYTNPDPNSPPSASSRYSFIPKAQFVNELAPACTGTPSHTTALASSAAVCEKDVVNFSLSGVDFTSGLDYVWQYNDGSGWTDFMNSSTANFSDTMLTTIDVRALVTCTATSDQDISDVVNVLVNTAPTVTVDVDSLAFCSGTSVIINAAGANTYTWTPATGLDVANAATVNANPTSSTTYTITGTDLVGCKNTTTSTVTPISKVNRSVTYSPNDNCTFGSPVTITGNVNPSTVYGGGTWEYRFLNVDGTTAAQDWNSSNVYNFIPTADSVYSFYYQVRSNTCTDYIDSVLVQVTIGFGADVSVIDYDCQNLGGTIALSNDFGQTEGGIIFANPLNDPLNVTNITFSGTASINNARAVLTPSATGATGTMNIQIPGFSAGLNNAMEVTFNMTADQPINNYGTGGADGIAYSFANDASSGSGTGQSGRGSKLRLAFDAADNSGSNNYSGIYLVYGNTGTGDLSTVAATTLAYSTNVASWKLLTDVPVKLTIDANGKASVFVGGTLIFDHVQLPASYLTADVSNWQHFFSAGTGGDAMRQAVSNFQVKASSLKYALTATTVTPTTWVSNNQFTNVQPGFYDIWLSKDATGSCSKMIGTYEVANLNPKVVLGNDTSFCSGSSIVLDAGNTGSTYVWSNSTLTTQTITASNSGTYVVYVTNPSGCVGIGTINLHAEASPSAAGIYVQGSFPTMSFALVNPIDADMINWNFGDGNTALTVSPNTTHTYTQNGTYTVTATIMNNCDTIVLTQSVSVETASIIENQLNGLTVYPNPTNEIVNISFPQNMEATIVVFSVDGSKIYEAKETSDLIRINTQNWNKGVYMIHVQSEEGNKVVKLIVE